MKKRLLMLMLASTLVFSTCAVTGCGEDSDKEDDKDKDKKDKKDKDKDDEDEDEDEDEDDDKSSKKKDKKDKEKEEEEDDDDKSSKKDKKEKEDDEDDDKATAKSSVMTLEEAINEEDELYDLLEECLDLNDDMYFSVWDDEVYVTMYIDADDYDEDELEYLVDNMDDAWDEEKDSLCEVTFDEVIEAAADLGIEFSGKFTLTLSIVEDEDYDTLWSGSADYKF